MAALDDLATHLQAASRAPFLFVGAGMSRRYLKADGWLDLLKRMASLTPMPYAFYATKANNQLPPVASEIASRFHELWWTDDRFEESRRLYGDRLTSAEGPLKVEVARYTDGVLANLPADGTVESRELELLRKAVIGGAITTNYDGLLETLFPDYRTFVGQDQLLFADTQGIGEIYKVHGSANDPESLVLTEADYERFGLRNPYLAAKLLTIFVEHPIVFLGYSLNDEDVTEILVSIARVLTTENLSKLQGRLIFVQWSGGTGEPAMTMTQIAASGFTIPVVQVTVPDFLGLFSILGSLRRKFPAQLLRQLKEHVYDLVFSTDPRSQLSVLDIDDNTNIRDLDVVFGVGVMGKLGRQGYVGLKRLDLLQDVLTSASQYEAGRVVDEALPVILRQPANTPVFRYLREAGRLRDDGSLAPGVTVDQRIADRVAKGRDKFKPGSQFKAKAERLLEAASCDFEALASDNPLPDVLLAVLALPEPELDLDALRTYLLEHVDAFTGGQSSAWAKAVCLYDYLRFARI
ncbi:MAG: SIR2 family protein [Jatrophihabitantaceae bacterium]